MRFFLSILGVVIFIVVVIVIIASHGAPKVVTKPISLSTYNTPTSTLTQITTGQLVADSRRQAIKITVTQSQVSIYILNGYNQTIAKSESFANNSTAYGDFLGAVQLAGFTNSRLTTQSNMFGICPLGNTYQYQLNNGSKTTSNLWSTSCRLSDGTFNGNGSLIRQLFNLQVPNYSNFLNKSINNSLTSTTY